MGIFSLVLFGVLVFVAFQWKTNEQPVRFVVATSANVTVKVSLWISSWKIWRNPRIYLAVVPPITIGIASRKGMIIFGGETHELWGFTLVDEGVGLALFVSLLILLAPND